MVIVGAGECGSRAALSLRSEGYEGPVTLIGEEAHLPYERPPLSKDTLLGPDNPLIKTIAAQNAYDHSGIEFLASRRAVSIDRHDRRVVLDEGRAVSYDRLLLATGCRPRRLAGVAEGNRITYLRTFDDALNIRSRLMRGSRLLAIGAGFVGLEVAAAARAQGLDVTVLEAQPRILMRGVPACLAERIHALHAVHGVRIVCGAQIAALEHHDSHVAATTRDGETHLADLVLAGIGAMPNVSLADEAGLAIDNGIAVDACLATSDPAIFAAGDCCSFPLVAYSGRRVRVESWRNAQDQGAAAARNMLGAAEPYCAMPWFWSDQYDHSVQVAGLPDEAMPSIQRPLRDGGVLVFQLAVDGRIHAASGYGPGNLVAKDIKLAEMMIRKGCRPDPAALADPTVSIKSLLAA